MMASYDTSVVIRCIKGDENACRIMREDNECVIPPTVESEVRSFIGRIPDNCRIYTYDTDPFDTGVMIDVNDFVLGIREVFFSPPKRGKKKYWEVDKRDKVRFDRLCTVRKNGRIDENDWRIVKESNILVEKGKLNDNRLISDDKHITRNYCIETYRHVMNNLDEIVNGRKEDMLIDIVRYEDII